MAHTKSRTFYDILGLQANASKADVKNAYRKLALRCHPDKNPGDHASVALFQQIGEAYETLSDNEKRATYNRKIRYGRTSPFYFYADPNTFMGRAPPVFNSFWNRAPNPSQNCQKPFGFEADVWGEHSEPEDTWKKWAEQEEEAKKAKEKQRAARREERKKQMVLEIPSKLTIISNLISRLDSAIENVEANQKAAQDTIETGDEPDSEFWDNVFDMNVKLNTLRKERGGNMNEYQRLYRDLKKYDMKKSDEFKEAYQGLRKRASGKDEVIQSNLQDFTNHAATSTEQRHPHQDEIQEDLNRQHETMEPSHQENTGGQQGEPWSSEEAWPPPASGESLEDKQGTPVTQPDSPNEVQAKAKSEHGGDKVSEAPEEAQPSQHPDLPPREDETPDEVILYQQRLLHTTHKEAHADFWDFVDGLSMCSFCGATCAVLHCPRFEECKLSACEYCKSSH